MSRSLVLAFLLCQLLISTTQAAPPGQWQLLTRSAGISVMHMQLLFNDRVVMFDCTDFGFSNISLPDGKCRFDDPIVGTDCTAHSVEYNVLTNTVRPLMIHSDVWCSSGAVMADGRLVQTGGFTKGDRRVRTFTPCNTCDWEEIENGLLERRWYATNHILPDGRQIIIGGRRQFNYEFYPKVPGGDKIHSLPFLVQTDDVGIENNLYPFVFLYPDGNLFIFANNRAILFNYAQNQVIRTYPTIPGGDPRSYPSTGSAVLLPLRNINALMIEVEVLVCGGAPKGSYQEALKGRFHKALDTCARLKVSDLNPQWIMEKMPTPRVMSDMTLLPNGNVLLINGAAAGTAGWTLAREPVLSPVVYRSGNAIGSRFEIQKATTIPRMYHSTAILLRDGRILVGGSNTNAFYNFTNVLFPTELSLEAFSPTYLESKVAPLRPRIIPQRAIAKLKYNQKIPFRFTVPGTVDLNRISVTMVAPSFTTHSFSMNQRLLFLDIGIVTSVGRSEYQVIVTMPRSPNLAPAGYYMVFVVHQDLPSEGIWVHMHN